MKMKTPALNARRCLTGFTMIEIMIVISIAESPYRAPVGSPLDDLKSGNA